MRACVCVCSSQFELFVVSINLIICIQYNQGPCRGLVLERVLKLVEGTSAFDHTCKRLTSSLPKLSLITLSPPETAGSQVGRIYGRICQYPSDFISWGYRGEHFSSSTWGKSEVRYYCGWWDSNPRPQKPMVCRRRHLLRN